MGLLVAALLGVVEGLTEFLPVSSTGHLVLVGHLLGHEDETAKAFDVVIQLGAVLAVCVHYRALLAGHARGLLARRAESVRLAGAVLVGFLPIAVVGLLLRKAIKAHLFGSRPVAAALIVGGVAMLALELRDRGAPKGDHGLERVTLPRALGIGLGQCLALWPGMSRSMSTILAGRLAGLDNATAAEFSFLLSVPVLGAATTLDLVKERSLLLGERLPALAVATAVSFAVSLAVIAGFLRYLQRRGLVPFAIYRLVVGAVVLGVVPAADGPPGQAAREVGGAVVARCAPGFGRRAAR